MIPIFCEEHIIIFNMSVFSIKKRYYQDEVNEVISQSSNEKDLVKMFCGTGKSLIMRTCPINLNQNLIAFVFPSLQLIEQFASDYIFPIDLQKHKQIEHNRV